ncbi:uncharacterized protein zgc:113184 isoform X2 [Boleophthalmus pectinirostris]|uniref:uncharacterized protein zgc:113184 isoform X2 n=1 Tax=Boleophthalmus pectinirostris TaxID=150288 RepID=UPI00242D8D5A|nr:uncharacterized protein zgc:113184 isoform X2 [Boleophthalmus pectinirostris]
MYSIWRKWFCLYGIQQEKNFTWPGKRGSNKDPGDLPTQLDSEYPVYLNSSPHPTPPLLTPAAPCGVQESSINIGNFSNLLAQDMSKLSVNTSVQKKDPKSELSIPQSLSSVLTLSNGASYNKCLHHNGEDTERNTPVTGYLNTSGTPYSHHLPTPGGMMISDVTLQSHLCEFCQAVFPANTTTRGQYLQHLYTHIT